PNAKNVRGSNYCEIGLKVNKRTNTLIIVSAIDNLVKGASGQAVQNMNIIMGFKETTALGSQALFP
ncbi:MAG: N-acetyl-gamma-glutamyl-phosphate reductase, partial [Nitrospirae bacterium]|nr:N-acetyl-gamma-glutamyl-phosphate reductase [Nitrospirota bacterium]